MRRSPYVVGIALAGALSLTMLAAPATAGSAARATINATAAAVTLPLAGVIIAIDPGHQLGNSNPRFFSLLNKKTFVGGTVPYKICNTTGTATNSGYPEATYNFAVAQDLRAALRALGATVVMTRYTNTWNSYGPCIKIRGQFGLAQHAVLKVSIHADGAASGGHGFFVMEPANIARPCLSRPSSMVTRSRTLGRSIITGMVRAGLTKSTYINNATMISSDQGTLNCSSIPTVIVETLNMRNTSDANLAKSPNGRAKVAKGLLNGIRIYLGR